MNTFSSNDLAREDFKLLEFQIHHNNSQISSKWVLKTWNLLTN